MSLCAGHVFFFFHIVYAGFLLQVLLFVKVRVDVTREGRILAKMRIRMRFKKFKYHYLEDLFMREKKIII